MVTVLLLRLLMAWVTQKLIHKGDIASPGVAMLSLYNPSTLMMGELYCC